MAGYAARTEAYIEEFGGGNYIKFSNFDLVAYIIHNAGEIGLPDDYILPFRLQGQLGTSDSDYSMLGDNELMKCPDR